MSHIHLSREDCIIKSEFTIRDLAAEFDVTARTLRFYEQKGLLNPGRKGASRVYSIADRARLVLILRGKRVGFSLDEIREMLDMEAITTQDPSALTDMLERFHDRIDALNHQREDIDAAIAELEAGRTWLEDRLANREPTDEIKHRARAFEALAAARMNVWTGASPEPGSHETQT
ncbi:MerR family transcriptional regulator [Hyphobacterium indicum]|uniref:MerR family transcriptional regulator n=1 Tax=Hyphobacterium indicum TaxID=2162714 RepID=UPI001475C81A|nr:MerR family DNA-binding transcriptional regulator [Hyphobacterium indicum]